MRDFDFSVPKSVADLLNRVEIDRNKGIISLDMF